VREQEDEQKRGEKGRDCSAEPTTERELLSSPSDFIEGSVCDVHVFKQLVFVCEISFEKLKLNSIAKLILLYTKKTQITK